jgi:hypothetical protein
MNGQFWRMWKEVGCPAMAREVENKNQHRYSKSGRCLPEILVNCRLNARGNRKLSV